MVRASKRRFGGVVEFMSLHLTLGTLEHLGQANAKHGAIKGIHLVTVLEHFLYQLENAFIMAKLHLPGYADPSL